VSAGNAENSLTATDANGAFSVRVNPGETLYFRLIGFVDRSIKLRDGQTHIEVRLAPDASQLEEVVVRGYVVRSKEETTGASFGIKGDEIQDIPVSNAEQLLQGKVPGLNIQVNTGAP